LLSLGWDHENGLSRPQSTQQLERRNPPRKKNIHLMKTTTLMMCLIAAFAVFASPVYATRVDKSGPITFENMFVTCNDDTVTFTGELQAEFTFTKNNKGWDVEGVVSLRRFSGETNRYKYVRFNSQERKFKQPLLNGMGNFTFPLTACVNGISKPACGRCGNYGFAIQQTLTFRFRAPATVEMTRNAPTISCGKCPE
jgi:hypothetical protein